MKKPHQVTAEKQQKILEEAADKRIPVVLSYKTMKEWQTYNSHLVTNISDNGSLFIAYPTSTDYSTPEINPGQNVDISFRWGSKKILFNTSVAGRYRDKAYNMPILKLDPPNNMYEHQRRLYERVPAPQGMKIPADLWIENKKSDESQTSTIIRGVIMDISAGGANVAVSTEHKPNCNNGDTVVCSFTVEVGRSPDIIYTQFRNWQDMGNGYWLMGLQFTGLRATQQGQAQLERILILIDRFKQAARKQSTSYL